jgi:hypothetical protein
MADLTPLEYTIYLCPTPGRIQGQSSSVPSDMSTSLDEDTNTLTVTIYLITEDDDSAVNRIFEFDICPSVGGNVTFTKEPQTSLNTTTVRVNHQIAGVSSVTLASDPDGFNYYTTGSFVHNFNYISLATSLPSANTDVLVSYESSYWGEDDCGCDYEANDITWEVTSEVTYQPTITWTNPSASCMIRGVTLSSDRRASLIPYLKRVYITNDGSGEESMSPLYPDGDPRNPSCVACPLSGTEHSYVNTAPVPGEYYSVGGCFDDISCGTLVEDELQTPQDENTVTVSTTLNVFYVSSVTLAGDPDGFNYYTGGSFSGNVITLGTPLPSVQDVLVTYIVYNDLLDLYKCNDGEIPRYLGGVYFSTNGYTGGYVQSVSGNTYSVSIEGEIISGITSVDNYEPEVGDWVVVAKLNTPKHDFSVEPLTPANVARTSSYKIVPKSIFYPYPPTPED